MGTLAIPEISSEVLEALHTRYAVKKYDRTRKISQQDLETLLSAIELAPTSYGLQPIKALVITDPEVRAKLRPAAWGQSQITDASHLVLFLAKKEIEQKDVNEYMQRIARTRNTPLEKLAGMRDMITSKIVDGDKTVIRNWAARQAYIALGFLLEAAAMLRIDTTPMEGFEAAEFDRILGLEGSEWSSVVLCAIGYRAADDSYVSLKKVRKSREEMIEFV